MEVADDASPEAPASPAPGRPDRTFTGRVLSDGADAHVTRDARS